MNFKHIAAALVGILLAVAYYEFGAGGSDNATSATQADLSPVGTLEINEGALQGSINAYTGSGSLVLDVEITSDVDSELQVIWGNRDLAFQSLTSKSAGGAPGFLFAKGNFGMSTSQEKNFRMELALPDQPEAISGKNFSLFFHRAGYLFTRTL